MTITGQRKSFQELRNRSMATVASVALISGATTVVTMRTSPAPSIRAASIRSMGMFLIACRMRNTPKALAKLGARIPA